MGKTFRGLISLFVLSASLNANAFIIEISGSGAPGVDGTWEISIISGSFENIADQLTNQVWYTNNRSNGTLAQQFAEAAAASAPSDLLPYFVFTDVESALDLIERVPGAGAQVGGWVAVPTSGTAAFSAEFVGPDFDPRFDYAVAERVDAPVACSVPISPLSQTDNRWAGDPLASTNLTLGGYGCAVTALAMAINSEPLAIDVMPNQLNAVGSFTSGGGLIWQTTTANWWRASRPDGANPLKFRSTRTNSRANPDGALAYIEDALCNRQRPVVIHLPNDPPAPFGHFVTVFEIDGDELTAIDPFGGVPRRITLGEEWETRGYVVDPPDIHSISAAIDGDGGVAIFNSNGAYVGDDGSEVRQDLPESDYFVDSITDKLGSLNGFSTRQATVFTPEAGAYQISAYKNETGPVTVKVVVVAADGTELFSQEISRLVEAGIPADFDLVLDPFGGVAEIAPSAASLASLRRELDLANEAGLIFTRRTFRRLAVLVGLAEAFANSGLDEPSSKILDVAIRIIQSSSGGRIDAETATALLTTAKAVRESLR